MRLLIARIGVVVALCSGFLVPQPAHSREPPPATAPRLQRDRPLPEETRALLTAAMQKHRERMESLLWASLMLEHQAVQELAEAIAQTPPLPAAPTTASQRRQRNPQVDRFFVLQEELRQRARELARHARAGDAEAVAVAHGKLTTTCVRCHALYLRMH